MGLGTPTRERGGAFRRYLNAPYGRQRWRLALTFATPRPLNTGGSHDPQASRRRPLLSRPTLRQ
jgi:hypothetical protein